VLIKKTKYFIHVNTTHVRVGVGSRAGAVIHIYGSAEPEPKVAIYAPVRNVFDACRYITRASGRGLGRGNLEFLGLKMALAYQLDAISRGPKNSRFPGLIPLPLAQVMDLPASKVITHRDV
jgi:hypothetical protein